MGKMISLIKNYLGKIAFLIHILDLKLISQIHQENFEIILSITILLILCTLLRSLIIFLVHKKIFSFKNKRAKMKNYFSSDRSARFADRSRQSDARRSSEGGQRSTSFSRRDAENVPKRDNNVDGKRRFTFIRMAIWTKRMSELFNDWSQSVSMRKFKVRSVWQICDVEPSLCLRELQTDRDSAARHRSRHSNDRAKRLGTS